MSARPYADAFLKWPNLKLVLIAFASLMCAQGAIWFCVFFYAQVFLETFMKVDAALVNYILIGATLLSIPLYVLFGALSDKVGRKPVLLFGIGLGAVAIIPAFHALALGTNPTLSAAQEARPVTLTADPATCSFQFDLLGRARYETGCDIARNVLTRAGVGFTTVEGAAGSLTTVRVGEQVVDAPDALGLAAADLKTAADAIGVDIRAALSAAGYPEQAATEKMNWALLAAGFAVLVIAATALYGPLAAAIVELFPTNIRYTALSLPYHVGVGFVGGFTPMTAFAISAASGDVFAGLWYSVAFAAASFVACLLLFPETRGRPLDADG
jgi:MFS family permease